MARKPARPALYELMGGRGRAEPAAEAPPPAEEAPVRWFSPGRRVRLPVGYVWLAGAVLLALVVAGFSMGYARGRADARAEFDQDWLATHQPSLPMPPPEVQRQEPRGGEPPPSRDAPAAPAPAEAGDAGDGWGPILSDPRVPGRNYFVLIHTRRENAVRLAEFCREHGVEAYAIPANNVSLHRVIVLPGYESGERRSAAVEALERRLEIVARRWKVEVNAQDDLTAYYPERYDG